MIWRALFALSALVLAPRLAPADSMQAIERAMGPYYAALVASARGNTDATSRHLLLFASRWESASREARSAPPKALEGDPAWPGLIDKVNDSIVRARELVRARDVASAHAELETIRSALREIRARHHALTFDDHMTEYHEAVERVLGHLAGRNEIRLTPKDFTDADEDLGLAKAAWQAVQASAGAMAAQADWAAAARKASDVLSQTARAISAQNATQAGASAEQLKSNYYDLLLAVSKARG